MKFSWAGSFIFLLAWCVCCYRDFYKYTPPLFLVLLQSWLKEEITWFLTSVSVMETPYAAFSVCLFLFFKTWFQILKKSSIAVDLVTWHNLLSLYIDFTNWTHDVSLNHKIEDSCDEERYIRGSNWSHKAYCSSTFNNLDDFRIFLFYVSLCVCFSVFKSEKILSVRASSVGKEKYK